MKKRSLSNRERRPKASRSAAASDSADCNVDLSRVRTLPPELVQSAVTRLRWAIQCANFDWARRIVADAERATNEHLSDHLVPLEDRHVRCLHELAGLPQSTCDALACIHDYRHQPVMVRDVIDYGQFSLSRREPFNGARARLVFAAIGAARREIERQIQALTCWRFQC